MKRIDPVTAHVRALRSIFPKLIDTVGDSVVYEKLRNLEHRAHRQAERECNYSISEEESQRIDGEILDALDNLLGFRERKIPIFLNGDPRGYAIKIHDSYVREHKLAIHTDWGGYGIIAPEL
jgi:hypothetical protein